MIRKIFSPLLDLETTKVLLGLRFAGYLYEIGWFKAFKSKMPINQKMEPLPWVTYPFIDFIGPRLTDEMKVFEFGAGNSTFYYASKVAFVTSVEHDQEWYNKLKKEVPANSELLFEELEYNGLYTQAAINTGKMFDLIIIDGRNRVNCAIKSIAALTSAGVLILDDSERTEYTEIHLHLKSLNFKQIDFWGIAPGLAYKKCTTIFYKDNNCLDI